MEVKEPSSLSLHELKRVEAQVTVLQAQVQQLESEKRLLELKVKQWETKEKKPTTCHEVETQTEEKEKEEEEEEEEEEGPILRHAMVQVCLDEPMSPGEYEDVDEGQVVDGSSSSSSSVISTPPCLHSKVDLQHVLLKCNDPRFSSKRPADLLGTSPRLSNPRLEKSHPPSPLPWVKKTTPPVPIPPFSTVSPPPTNLSSTEKLQAHATWLKGFLDVLEHTHLNFQHGMVRDDP
ncbi:hypothetical protein HMI55_001761 [Coelomomyces lativittatus]|nr:hypothetical protein HMI55_001761 [Coelomomyces lativittatus]